MANKTLKLDNLLKLVRLDANKFITKNYPMAPVGSPASFGGTQMAQSILASMYTIPNTHIPNSFHCYFINGGDPEKHITYDVENLRTGNSYIHKQVRGYQDGKLIFTSLILFSKIKAKGDAVVTHPHPHLETEKHPLVHHLKKLEDPPRLPASLNRGQTTNHNNNDNDNSSSEIQYVPAADLFKEAIETIGPETVAKFPIFQKFGGLDHINYLYEALKYYSPVEFYFPSDFYLAKDKTLNRSTKERVNYFFRIRPESALITTDISKTITANKEDQIEPTTDFRYNYAALAFLSDRYLLLTLPYFKGAAIYSHDFGCSLDHSIYFHRVPLVNEFMVMSVENPRSLGSRHLFEGDVYDLCGGDATLLASVLQEGLAGYGNVLGRRG